MFRHISHSRAVQAVCGLGLGLLTFGMVTTGTLTEAAAATPAAAPSAQTAVVSAEDVVAKVAPAVVTVVNEQQYNAGVGAGAQLQPVGSGTGFVIDNQGHIVTNWHVVQGGEKFFVIFSDGTKEDATLVGSDEVSDIAVVQVKSHPSTTLSFGDSNALKPGEPVLAIGSPLGSFSNTVTEGIVGATGRNFPYDSGGPQVYDNLIQHDAPINPGNSGGPLLDLQGNVVGVNTLGIPTDDQGQPVQGLFFAIPSSTVKTIVNDLITDGKVVYPFFGITPVTIDPVSAAANDLPVDNGAYVADVGADSPAAAAGIQQGDIILSIAGTKIDQQTSFTEALFPHKPGETVAVTLQRGDQQLTEQVTLGQRPMADTSSSAG
ncbi:MAG TPA: trypsin-like peptidase domain-containing protein [Thermomicrobiales bacterium]|jgi:2-alkenal reductase